MIHDIILPQLAMGMAEGTIVDWLAVEGDEIDRDTLLLSIETEKVTTELPSAYSGFIHIIVEEGTTVPVETLIAQVASTKEEYEKLLNGSSGAVVENAVAAEDNVTAATVSEEPLPATRKHNLKGRIKVSGLAKKIAGLEEIALSDVTGTGPGGRIVKRDIAAILEQRKSGSVSKTISYVGNADMGMREKQRIPLSGMRGAIARNMMQATGTAAQNPVYFEVDVTNLLLSRQTMLQREEQLGIRVSLTSIYARALALACQHVPICNATLSDDQITIWENVNVGIAVAVPGKGEYDSGLFVPVVKNAGDKNVLELAQEIKHLVNKGRSGELSKTDMADRTITLSSTGGLAAPGAWVISAPILNLPDVISFQPGTPVRKPVIIDDEVVARDILPCGLTFDHRAVDGEPVLRFIRKITDLLSNPELMML